MPASRSRCRSGMRFAAVAFAILLAGCATAYESGIQDRGGGVFFVAVRTPGDQGGGDASAKKAAAQASSYCAKSGRIARIANREVGPYEADLIFTCVEK